MKRTTPQLIFADQFNTFLKASASGRRLTPSGRKLTAGTITNYRHTQQLLTEFEKHSTTPLRIQLLHRASMRTIQQEKNYWAAFCRRFTTFLYKQKRYTDSSVANNLKIIKACFNYLQAQKGYVTGNFHKSFRVPQKQALPIVLPPHSLRFLITNQAFEASLSPGLKKVKDIFVFGATVALRVTDLMNLQKKHLLYTPGEVCLNVCTQKTGTQVRIPLPGYAVDIINRYKTSAGKYLLPRLSVTNLNIQVKKLIYQAGWNYPLVKWVSRHGRLTELKNADGTSWRFHQHITAHTMRRTAITTLLMMGVPEMLVRKLSGHAPASKEFYRYVSIAQEYLSQEVRAAFQKLVDPAPPQA